MIINLTVLYKFEFSCFILTLFVVFNKGTACDPDANLHLPPCDNYTSIDLHRNK